RGDARARALEPNFDRERRETQTGRSAERDVIVDTIELQSVLLLREGLRGEPSRSGRAGDRGDEHRQKRQAQARVGQGVGPPFQSAMISKYGLASGPASAGQGTRAAHR